jgi:hypothetical protein
VKRTKVALDANIPERLVRMLQSGFGDQGYEFLWEPDFAAANAGDDVWTVAFRRFGGQLVITGDKNLARRPHQVLGFIENDLVGFFFERKWAERDLAFKAAHMMMWWPRIQRQYSTCRPRDCWWVPSVLRDGAMRKVELPKNAEGKRKRSG